MAVEQIPLVCSNIKYKDSRQGEVRYKFDLKFGSSLYVEFTSLSTSGGSMKGLGKGPFLTCTCSSILITPKTSLFKGSSALIQRGGGTVNYGPSMYRGGTYIQYDCRVLKLADFTDNNIKPLIAKLSSAVKAKYWEYVCMDNPAECQVCPGGGSNCGVIGLPN